MSASVHIPAAQPIAGEHRDTDEPRRSSEPSPRPVDYGTLNGLYAMGILCVLVAQRRRDDPDRIDGAELLPLGLAAFSLSKAIAREKIGTWIREPFVDETEAGPRPRGGRLRQALGELVTCTRCVGAWSSLGIVGLRILHPSTGRAATSVLATAAINDFLQAGFQAFCGAANELDSS